MEPSDLLAAYDSQLRREAEVLTAADVTHDGPLVRARFGRSGFVTYRDLDGLTGSGLDALIARTVGYFRDQTDAEDFEWKTRAHDAPADLADHLVGAGLSPGDDETVMIGEATALTVPVELPDAVVLRRLDPGSSTFPDDVGRMAVLQSEVFGDDADADVLVSRLTDPRGVSEAWVAEVAGDVVCAGRLEVVTGTDFAGLWGGGTRDSWRGHGIYRALVSARAQVAVDRGIRYLHSDCTPMSRPILERSGLSAITTTTPFVWRRHPKPA